MSDWEGMTIAHRIKIAAQIRQLTIQELAKKARVPRSTLYHIISGNHIPLLENVLSVATALNVRLGWLLEGEEPIFRVAETTKTAQASSPVPHRRTVSVFPDVPALPIVPAVSRRQRKHKA